MATFAPYVSPTNDPNYLNYSKPISNIEGDKSSGMLLKGLGDVLDGGVAVADQITKDVINTEIRTGVEKQRDAFTTALVAYADQQAGAGVIPSPQSQAVAGVKAPLSLAANEQNMPAGVQAVANRVQSIGTAITQNSGKSNDTLYTGALASMRKTIATKYPGYVDYIDQKIAQVSGIEPANAYYRNLMEDINRNATQGKSEVDKAIALGRQYLGYDPQMPGYIEAVRQGLPGSIQNLEGRINDVASKKIQFDELERLRKVRDWGKEDDTVNQTNQFAKEIRSKAKLAWEGVVQIPGLNSPQTIQQLLDDQRAGRISLTDEQNSALLNAATLARDTWQRQSVEIMRSRGYTQSIPKKEERDKIIADEGFFFEQQIQSIKDKTYGTMYGNERRMKSIQDDTGVSLLTHKDMGAYNRTVAGLRQIGGDNWVNYVQAESLKAGVTPALKDFIQDVKLKIGQPVNPANPEDSRSIYEDVKKAQQAKINPNTGLYDDLVGNVKFISMKEPPKGVDARQFFDVKKNIVDYMFDPTKNGKLVDRFSKDFTDSDGVYHPGKFAMYDTLTQRGIVDNIWDMKDQASWQKYRDWNELSFRKLFGENVMGLNNAQQDQSMLKRVVWNSDTKQFALEFNKPVTTVDQRYATWANEQVRELNKGLRNLAYMHDKEGKDTSAYLLETLTAMGYAPNNRLQGVNLPQKIVEAIANSAKKEDRINEAFDAARGK